MAQRKPEEQITFDQVLKLVKNLGPEAQAQLVEEMKLQWLQRAIVEGEESIKQHGAKDADEVFSKIVGELERKKA